VKPRQPKKMLKPPRAVSQACVPPSGAGPKLSSSVGTSLEVCFSISSFDRLMIGLNGAKDGFDMVLRLGLIVGVNEEFL
jgi:hypothetical protein